MATTDFKTPDKLKTVFVIAPIGKLDGDGNDFGKLCLEQIIKPAAKDCGGYEVPVRADEHHKPGSVAAKVVTAILDADVCVADLTGRNANVMYEVAIAHAAGKPVVLLQQEDGGPPFDFADERVIHYGLRVDLANTARAELVSHLRAAQEDEEDGRLKATMNPVRVLFGQLKAAAKASEPERAFIAELQAMRREVAELAFMVPRLMEPNLRDSAIVRLPRVRRALLMRGLELGRMGRLSADSLETLRQRIELASSQQIADLEHLFNVLERQEVHEARAAAENLIDGIVPF